jgi:hypothetical protein
MLAALAHDPDIEHGMIDATIMRAHPCAAGAQMNTANKRWVAAEVGSVARFTSPLMA